MAGKQQAGRSEEDVFKYQHTQGEIFLLPTALLSSSTLYSSPLLPAPRPGCPEAPQCGKNLSPYCSTREPPSLRGLHTCWIHPHPSPFALAVPLPGTSPPALLTPLALS